MKNFIFKKNIPGGLIFTLESYDFSLPARTFDMPFNIGQLAIPEQYALGLFVSSDALNMFQKGLFVIEDFEDLKKKADEIGLFGGVELNKIYSSEEIAKAISENDEKIINEILKRKNSTEMDALIALVRSDMNNNGKVSHGIITKIEDACGVELAIE